MRNNFYDIPNDWYSNFNNTFTKENNLNSSNLTTPKEALQRGNLFNNLYIPYKNYNYEKLTPTNKREEILFNLLKYKFALKELNLYLDVFPLDNDKITLYNKYLDEAKKIEAEYEKSYGPLILDNNVYNNWQWIKSPWPWEGTK